MRYLIAVMIFSAVALGSDAMDRRETDTCDKPRWTEEQRLACRVGFVEGVRWQFEETSR